MDTAQPPIQIEGIWEDILRHSDQFVGKRVRVTVLAKPSRDELAKPSQEELRERAKKWIRRVDRVQSDPKASDADFPDDVGA